MSEEEFQFFKNKLKIEVREYLDLDDQIKALNKALKERREKKKQLSENILGNMNKFQIDFMNTRNGKLIYNKTKRKEPLNKHNLITGLNSYLDNIEESQKITKHVLDSRKDVVKISLRRTINKKNKTLPDLMP